MCAFGMGWSPRSRNPVWKAVLLSAALWAPACGPEVNAGKGDGAPYVEPPTPIRDDDDDDVPSPDDVTDVTEPPPPPPAADPTPFAYHGVGGNIPSALCSRNLTVHIASITPNPAMPLATSAPVTFAATISYAFTSNENLRLVLLAYDKDGNSTTFSGNAVAAQAGCASVTATIENFDPSPYANIVVYPRTLGVTFSNQSATYFVEGKPYFRITATSHPLDKVLPFDAFGDVNVTVRGVWDLKANEWPFEGRAKSVLASDDVLYFPDLPTQSASAGTFSFRFHPSSCVDKVWTENFLFTDRNYNTHIDYALQWFALLPDVVAYALNRRLYSDVTTTTYAARLRNCTATDKDVTLASAYPWLRPQAGTITVPANAAVDVTYTALVAGRPVGLSKGAIGVHPAPGTFTTLPISVALVTIDPAGYVLSNPAFQWIDDAAAADRTVVFASGDDEISTVALPFVFKAFGTEVSSVSISTNGFVALGDSQDAGCCRESKLSRRFPNALFLNEADLHVASGVGEIRTASLGSAPDRIFVVTYFDVTECCSATNPDTYQVVLFEGSNDILVQYQALNLVGDAGLNRGDGLQGLYWTPVTSTAFRLHKQ